MSILTETYEGVPGGMNLAIPAQELTEFEARYLQDIMLHYPGLILQRGPVQPKLGLPVLPKAGTALLQTLDPTGAQRIAALVGDTSTGSLALASSDLSAWTTVPWNGILPTAPPSNPYRIVDAKAALTGGTWIGSSDRYDAAAPVQTLALWRGGNKPDYTTGTITMTRGSAAVTGAGTAWLSNLAPGMFLFGNTDDPFTNTYLGVIKSVNSDTSLTLGAVALYTATAKAYTATSIRGFCPRVAVGRITCAVSSPTVNGALTKFLDQGVNSGTWTIYRASDLTFVGKVSSVASNLQLTLAANAAIAMNNDHYIAFRVDGDYSINANAVAGRKMGFITALYAERQWYANLGQQFETTSRVYFSETSDPEAVDMSAFDGDFLDIGSSHGANTPIKALMPAYNALMVMKDNETFGIFGTSKTQFQVRKIEDDGVLSGMSVQPHGGGVIWAGRNGVWAYDGIEAKNLTQDKLGDYYKNAVRSFDPTTYRMWSFVSREHYFLFMESVAPSVAVIKGTVSNTPSRMTFVINLNTEALTVLTNVHARGGIVLPASTGETTWYLVNNDVPAPTGLAATPSAAGGTLATNTYYYKVTALNSIGESLGSAEVTAAVTGPNGSVALTWTSIYGATYRIYRGTSAGAENVFYTSTTNSFTDTGAASTGGSPPTTSQAKGVICDSADIFDTEAIDTIFCDQQALGPDFYMESKKYKVGDSMRKKLFKQLAINYLAQGGVVDGNGITQALKIDTVVGLNNVGKTSSTTFPATVLVWDNLPATYPTWDALAASVPTWDALVQAVFRPKRIKFLKRSQHLAFRIYKTSPSVSRVRLGPFQLGFKLQRAGRI